MIKESESRRTSNGRRNRALCSQIFYRLKTFRRQQQLAQHSWNRVRWVLTNWLTFLFDEERVKLCVDCRELHNGSPYSRQDRGTYSSLPLTARNRAVCEKSKHSEKQLRFFVHVVLWQNIECHRRRSQCLEQWHDDRRTAWHEALIIRTINTLVGSSADRLQWTKGTTSVELFRSFDEPLKDLRCSPSENVACCEESVVVAGCLLPGHRRSTVTDETRIHRYQTIVEDKGMSNAILGMLTLYNNWIQ